MGFCEETIFRGLGLSALRSWKGETYALCGFPPLRLCSSTLALQPFSEWPGIFFFGLLMAQIRLLGGVALLDNFYVMLPLTRFGMFSTEPAGRAIDG